MKFLFLVTLLIFSTNLKAQDTQSDSSSNPLQNFEFLVGGTWETNNTQQTFEWGIGEKSIVSKLYFTNNDSLKLVGEITWFWHPGLKAIKGYGTSIEMEMDFFDYTTSFETPTKMVNTFIGYGGHVDGVQQLETLEFIDNDKYLWTYYEKKGLEFNASYSITFRRISE
tara:strand:- start:4776 stop:5279 length:504 start_codon:yes stop_codon:yes gene_type:complete